MGDFVHLHVHTEYSLLDGASRLDALFSRVSNLGQRAVAITDHGVMYGVAEFYKKAQKYGIKPIIGCEVYVAPRKRTQKDHADDVKSGHLVLLAKNNIGYHNLMKIVSDAFINGYYYKPRTDMEQLKKYSEGLIALSACFAGDVQRLILNDNLSGASQKALEYRDIFGDDFYLELQDHGLEDDQKIITSLIDISNDTGIPLVATNDTHYNEKKDAYLQKVLMCISMNKSIDDEKTLSFKTDEFYIKSYDEMYALFGHVGKALDNTVKIADMCNVTLDFGTPHLPKFITPQNAEPFEYLRDLCMRGLSERYSGSDKYADRLNFELSVIKDMQFVDYFLIVSDFVAFAKRRKIAVGPGRGSATGSLVSYCLGITDIDPMKYDLIFERFLNPDRASMPDIDIDFCVERRQEVIEYLIDKYGADSVSQIITFGTLAARAAIKDVGRVLGIPYSTVESVSKHFSPRPGITIKSVLDHDEDLQNRYRNNADIKKLIDTALSVEGFPRHGSTHAAGVVVTDGPVSDYLPLAKNDDVVVTQFQKSEVEQLGLLKIDLLGLRNITVIDKTVKLIREFQPDFDINNIPHDDFKTFDMISKGSTFGVFQLESPGMRKLLTNLRPKSIDDIIAAVSLYRPGPMESIPKYLKNRNAPSKIEYKTKKLRPILSDTYGCIVYQEQVMQIARDIAGYTLGHADVLRAAMSKKKTDVMENERKLFIDGAVSNGIDKSTAESIFEEMSDFARYGFNKSHAAGYAVIAYRTAYLKANYPPVFMASLLTSVINNTSKIKEYVDECNRMQIKVVPPDINKSGYDFEAVGNTVYYGLSAVKNVGRKFVKAVVEERRNNGDFQNYTEFLTRMVDFDLNRRAIESLVKCGTFDCFGFSRKHMLSVYDKILNDVLIMKNTSSENQLSFFDDAEQPDLSISYFDEPLDEFDITQKLMYEKDSLGLYISEHPLKRFEALYTDKSISLISKIGKNFDKKIKIFGVIESSKIITTKQLRDMAYVAVEDISGIIDVVLFPKQFDAYKMKINEGTLVSVEGELSAKDDSYQLICNRMEFINGEKLLEKYKKLYLSFKSKSTDTFNETIKCLSEYPGDIPCVFYYRDSKKAETAGERLKVNLEYSLIVRLKDLLGENNIVIK